MNLETLLLPLPRSVRPSGGDLELTDPVAIACPEGLPSLVRLTSALGEHGLTATAASEPAAIQLALDPALPGGPEAYHLEVDPRGARVVGAAPAGLFHGLATLAQLVRLGERSAEGVLRLAGVHVDDHPAFPQRGALLDVSRDRVPTMETLFAVVDLLSGLKLNQLQLYTEHTFAYRGHEVVWRGADPLTPEEVRALDDYCAERFVELVPNQQSFGHMHRWLVHAPYRELAECPEGVAHPFSREIEPFSLCPGDPGSLALLADLYDQLLPCFRSDRLHVGLDETFDLGLGRSRAACAERGKGRVFLDFLAAVAGLARERGRRVQYWADVVDPALVDLLPADGTPCLWGYEADHPFAEKTRAFAEAGLPFLVCPGTSSWQSLAGRLANMTANVAAAARHGRTAGASGLLVTDWGDHGHLQPLPASFPGWLVAAEQAWNPDAPAERRAPEHLAALLSHHVLRDASGAAGRALVRLAAAGEATGVRVPNASPLSVILTRADEPFPPPRSPGMEALSAGGLERALGEIDAALGELAGERMAAADRDRVRGELELAGGLLRFACLLGLQRLHAGPGTSLADVDADVRPGLVRELEPLIEEHRRLWLARSRRGGLERSCAWLERVANGLDA